MKATITGWSETTLREHVDLLAGFAFKSEKFTDAPLDIPLVKGANVQQGYIDWENSARWPCSEYDNHKKYHLRSGDVVVAMDRPWVPSGLKYAWIKPNSPKSLLVQRVARLRATNSLLQSYLRYIIGSREFSEYLRRIVTGVNVPHISGAQIQSFKFYLPPLKAQRKIAAILSAYDDLIENNRRRIAILEEMARNLYREWFVKFRFPLFRDDGTIERIHDPERDPMQDSPLGPIPQGWEVCQFTDLAYVQSGGTPKKSEPSYWDGDIPFFTPKDAGSGFYCTGTGACITKPGLDKCSSRLYKPNTVFITARGTVGKVVLPTVPMAMNQSCYALQGKEGVGQLFLFTHTLESVHYFKKNTGGATFSTIIVDTFKTFRTLRPSVNLLRNFEMEASPIFARLVLLEKENLTLASTRDHLLPKLISGQVDVSDLDIELPAEVG